MDGKILSEAQIKYLATLPGKPELRAKLLGTMQAPSQKFVTLLNQVPSQFVRLLAAYRDSKGA
jgi:large subunit ribosomal protein L10